MNQLKAAHHENRLESKLKFFAKYRVLIIDEIVYMPIDLDSANLFIGKFFDLQIELWHV